MIGVDTTMDRRVTTLRIRPGTLLCFYTDGLVERPDRPLDDGLAWLEQVVTAESPEAACARVMGTLVGSESARDDIALLMIRAPSNFGTAHESGRRRPNSQRPASGRGGR
jgi:phosphoserine phosphatase RsbU/P